MIKLLAIGNLGKDCVIASHNGKQVINFSVAHTEKIRDGAGNTKEETTWIECAWWTESTAIAQYLKKGKQVFVEGSPKVRTYPKNDGGTGVSLTCRVFSLQLYGSAKAGGEHNTQDQGAPSQQSHKPEPAPQDQFDDSPF